MEALLFVIIKEYKMGTIKYTKGQMKNILTLADNYAKNNTTCTKTAVGCYIIAETAWRTVLAKGANRGTNCKEEGCLRVKLFGDNSKEHREVCKVIHSEVDALLHVPKERKEQLKGATAFVTRYPCDNCAYALVAAGIKTVVYGREFPISENAAKLFEDNGVEVIHIADWNCDETDTNN